MDGSVNFWLWEIWFLFYFYGWWVRDWFCGWWKELASSCSLIFHLIYSQHIRVWIQKREQKSNHQQPKKRVLGFRWNQKVPVMVLSWCGLAVTTVLTLAFFFYFFVINYEKCKQKIKIKGDGGRHPLLINFNFKNEMGPNKKD